jgi:hypothetical protein
MKEHQFPKMFKGKFDEKRGKDSSGKSVLE